jgi:flagella basal body P-ring formation protein FlgA
MPPIWRHLLLATLVVAPVASRAADTTPAERARAFAEQWLQQHYAQPGSRVQAKASALDPRLEIRACEVPLSASVANETRPMPRMTVQVRCAQADGWNVRVSVQLSVFRQVLVASRPLIRGDGLVAADVRAEERDITRLGYGYIETFDQLSGRALARPLSAGSVLTPAALGGRRMVRAGDHVELIALLDGIEVRAAGIALGSGDSGARLRVRNGSSGRVVDAEVRGPGQVVALP